MGNAVCPQVAAALGRCLALAAVHGSRPGEMLAAVPDPEYLEVGSAMPRPCPGFLLLLLAHSRVPRLPSRCVPPPRSLPQLFDAWEEEEQLPLPFYAAQLGIERFDGRLLQNIVNFLGDEEEVGWTCCSPQPCSRAERGGRAGQGGWAVAARMLLPSTGHCR